ncbi:MAG: glycosyltransferase [Ferruginibacter sp.]
MNKVLLIIEDLGGGGAERVFVNIANVFAENNIEVEFLVGIKTGVYLQILNPAIPVKEVGGTSLLKYLTSFPKIFKENNYTHIFTASHYPATAAIIAKKITGITAKIYHTHHYAQPLSRGLKHLKGDTILKLFHFFIIPYADKIIAVSNGALQWVRKFSHRKLPQGSFIYNPVFDDTIYDLAKEEVDFPVSIQDKILLLNVGRLAEQKDQLTLLKAFLIVRNTYPNAILFILGKGPLQLVLENFITEHNLHSSVFLIGFEDNPYKWMDKCDVFILSSQYEGFGNVLVEAMALGKTVVSTNCIAGPEEILNRGEFGYLCPVKNPEEMAVAISNAIVSPLDPAMIKQTSKQYGVDKIVKQYIDIL